MPPHSLTAVLTLPGCPAGLEQALAGGPGEDDWGDQGVSTKGPHDLLQAPAELAGHRECKCRVEWAGQTSAVPLKV